VGLSVGKGGGSGPGIKRGRLAWEPGSGEVVHTRMDGAAGGICVRGWRGGRGEGGRILGYQGGVVGAWAEEGGMGRVESGSGMCDV